MLLQNKSIPTSDPRFIQSVPLLVTENNSSNNFSDSPPESNQTSLTLQRPLSQILKPKINPIVTTVPPTSNSRTSTLSHPVTRVSDLALNC